MKCDHCQWKVSKRDSRNVIHEVCGNQCDQYVIGVSHPLSPCNSCITVVDPEDVMCFDEETYRNVPDRCESFREWKRKMQEQAEGWLHDPL